MNWRGCPLNSYEVVVNSIAATTTRTGLTVHAELGPGSYPAGAQVTDAEMDALPLTRHDWHGDWNCTLRPEPPGPPAGPGTCAWAHPALTGLDPAQWDQFLTALHAGADEPPPIHLSLAGQALITIPKQTGYLCTVPRFIHSAPSRVAIGRRHRKPRQS